MQRAPELLKTRVLTKEEERKKSKVVGLSTEKMEEKGSKHKLKDTEDMVQWRSIDQEEVDNVVEEAVGTWKKMCWRSTTCGGEQEMEHTKEEVSRRSGW